MGKGGAIRSHWEVGGDTVYSASWVSTASTWIEGERGMSSPSMVAADGECPPLPRGRTVD